MVWELTGAINDRQFVWAFKSISLAVALYPVIIDGKDAFIVRTKSHGRKEIMEITDSFDIINVIIKRETLDAQWLGHGDIELIKKMLRDIEKIDVTEAIARAS